MMRHSAALLLVWAINVAAAFPPSVRPLTRLQVRQIGAWFAAMGPAEAAPSFGALVARAAQQQLGRPYDYALPRAHVERLEMRLDQFECMTLVESSLAMARCAWAGERHADCVVNELLRLRYRSGVVDGYASRLHYFEDWLGDNAARQRLRPLTTELGGMLMMRPFSYMRRHRGRYPGMASAATRAAIAQVEARLSAAPVAMLGRDHIAPAEAKLLDGDVIGIAGATAGIFVRHVGFAARLDDGRVHFLHASSLRRRVVLSEGSLAEFVAERSERSGIVVARPLPP